jgi:hypothetical protein
MTKRDRIVDFLSVKQLPNMFCEDDVLEAAPLCCGLTRDRS